MEQLKTRLSQDDVRGVARSADGRERVFPRKGVVDLYSLITDDPSFLKGGCIADRVIGRGAALLLVKGEIKEAFAYVMSEGAFTVLQNAGIKASFSTLQPYIQNRTGDGICPVEQLTASTSSPDEAYSLIGNFLREKCIID